MEKCLTQFNSENLALVTLVLETLLVWFAYKAIKKHEASSKEELLSI